jgi:hypothetical protein
VPVIRSLRAAVVEEVDIDGDVVSAIPSAARVTVGFIGAVLEIEQDYRDQRSACWTAMLRPYTKNTRSPDGLGGKRASTIASNC